MNPPRVFVSYSHDSAVHKMWVLQFSTVLRNRGIDIILDQWDLKPGDDMFHFMETSLESSDFVLAICSERYVKKANTGAGGAGYEKMILTSAMLNNIKDSNVIPIIRENISKELPIFLKSKKYIDFSNDEEIEYNFDELLRFLLDEPLFTKPEIGKNPFKPMEESKPDRTSDGVSQIMIYIADTFNRTSFGFIEYENLLTTASSSHMHRLTMDRYLEEAKAQGLIERPMHERILITPKGSDYLVEKDIIKE